MQDFLKLANRQIALNKPIEKIKTSLGLHFKHEDERAWKDAQRVGYEEIYPVYRQGSEFEWNEENTSDLQWGDLSAEDRAEFQIIIDYSEDESFISFSDWLGEAVITQEAQDAVFNEEGLLVTPAVPQITERVREFIPKDNYDAETDSFLSENTLEYDQTQTQIQLDQLTSKYPQFEIDTFWIQEQEARAYINDVLASTPFIDKLSEMRGIEKAVMIDKIIANSDALKVATSSILGAFQAKRS